jgi:hypothetical protein
MADEVALEPVFWDNRPVEESPDVLQLIMPE